MTSESSCPSRSVWVASEGDTTLVRITGRASFALGPCIKQLGAALVSQECRRIVFDMLDCEGVDSTFLGVLAGLSTRMKKEDKGEILLINLSPPLYENVHMLGLTRIMGCHETEKMPQNIQEMLGRLGRLSELPVESSDSESTRKTAIEAHEALIHSDMRNLPRFKDVLTFLKEPSRSKRT